MLSYRHAFHAGNHADVLKHIVLVSVLQYLKEKPKPFTVFDTHAGGGRYQLKDERLLRTGEAAAGIERLLAAGDGQIPGPGSLYLSICRSYAQAGYYPGSPEIERCLLSSSDSLILSELHPAEIGILRTNMALPVLFSTGSSREPVKVQIHHRDGYEMLKAVVPPPIRRGLAFIDPSYEDAGDYVLTAETVAAVHKKWQTGIILLWYPLLAHRMAETETMKQMIKAAAGPAGTETLDIQLMVNTPDSHREMPLGESAGTAPPRLYGSGVFILSPPWKLGEYLQAVLPGLADILAVDGHGTWRISRG